MLKNITNEHITKIRVYYGDTDCGKVVYYANYLKYFEIGRTEMLRDKGIELDEYHKQGIIFIVASVSIEYKFSAKYNDLLEICSYLTDFSKKTFTISNKIHNQEGRLIVNGSTKCACINSDGKLASIPDEILNVFNEILKTNSNAGIS
ncbi:acyl-CoA thioesterase [Candidatus Dependentiae bacterium]|nr:acyl-CoA thioesterase [Candidatus Dependentiae bacterium]